jgi:hypothetical protein
MSPGSGMCLTSHCKKNIDVITVTGSGYNVFERGPLIPGVPCITICAGRTGVTGMTTDGMDINLSGRYSSMVEHCAHNAGNLVRFHVPTRKGK